MEEPIPPASPGGTTVENGIETVTVTASPLPNWQKIAIIAAIAFALWKLAN